jgi:Ca2+/H+ antiporter, TMEM165/GDT1 family
VALSLAVTVYLAVLLAELLGDKTLYTVGTLATEYPVASVIAGSGLAVAIKMAVAVLLGDVLAHLPAVVVSIVSAATFLAMAVTLWVAKPESGSADRSPRSGSWARGASTAFFGILLTEWADFGQLTAATLVAEYRRPVLVWVAASLAMLTKVVIAVVFGMGFRRWVPRRVLRPVTTALCVLMAVLAAFRVEL